MTEQEHVLFLVMHHIISDGWSLGVFFRELKTLYEAGLEKRPSPLKPLPIQYADYAIWHRAWVERAVLQAQLSYWKGQLKAYPGVLDLPTDRSRSKFQTYEGDRHFLGVSKSTTALINKFCDEQGVTLFMVLLAAFNTLLYKYSGQEDIIVGSPIANRTRPEVSDVIGFFVNALPLRTDLSGDPTFLELIERVREVVLGAFEHQDMPFEKLVEELQIARNTSYSPLFQVTLVLQNMPAPVEKIADLTLKPMDINNGTAKYDFTVFFVPGPEGLKMTMEYNTALFDSATAKDILKHLNHVLEKVMETPRSRLSELSLSTQEDRQRMLVEWNHTQEDFQKDGSIKALFEAQAVRTPDAIAVVFEDHHLTYRELDQRANQLAAHLQQAGVGPNVLVGICAERSLEMVLGIMGVLKSGGAYLPMDPEYPRARLEYMLEDTKPPVLLTQEALVDRFSSSMEREISHTAV